MSIFRSIPPSRHGVTTNDPLENARSINHLPVPGLLELVNACGLRCAAAYNWEHIRYVSPPGHLVLSYFRNGIKDDPYSDLKIAEEAARCLISDKPDFMVGPISAPWMRRDTSTAGCPNPIWTK